MSIRGLVAEVAELCGHEEFVTDVVDLQSIGVTEVHVSAAPYFVGCVPRDTIDRPFFRLLSASEIAEHNTEFNPGCYILPFGFVTFANEPDGDAIAVDSSDGRIHLVSHETFCDPGILARDAGDPIPFTRDSILKYSEYTFPSISAFFETWRNELIELHRKQREFIDAAADDPNATDEFGNTLLVQFIRDGDTKMVKREVKRGASLDQFNSDRRTPLGEAVAFGEPRIVEYLLKCGADVNARNVRGTTPLMIAAQYSQLACMRILLKSGADRYATDSDGCTAAEYIMHGTPSAIRTMNRMLE